MSSRKSELFKLFKLKDIEGKEAAVMPSRPEVSRALEEHRQERCRSCCSSVLAETPPKPGKTFTPLCIMWVKRTFMNYQQKKIHQKL